METLEIKVPDNKTALVKAYLKELGVIVKVKKVSKEPNAETVAAMNELKAGKGKKFNNVDELFDSIWFNLMFKIVTSTKFLKDLKLLKKRSTKDLELLQEKWKKVDEIKASSHEIVFAIRSQTPLYYHSEVQNLSKEPIISLYRP